MLSSINNSFDKLQQQIQGLPTYQEQYQRLELYKRYPHLGEEEVDTYLALIQRRQGLQQGLELTKGKGKGLAGPEWVV